MSESYVTQGQIHSIGETTEYGSNGFTKRVFVVMLTGEGENPEFKNYVEFQLIKDKCALMDGYQPGHGIKIKFNLTGRLYDNPTKGEQCFPALQAWKIAPADGQQQQAPQQQYAQQPPPQQQPYPSGVDDFDSSIPF